MANANRSKGHKAEQDFARIFRELGFRFCKTTRETSQLLDNCKIDLGYVPWNTQIKAGAHSGLNVTRIFNDMRDLLEKNIPMSDPVHTKPFILIHRLKPYAASFDEDTVYMSTLQFQRYKINDVDLEFLTTKRYRTSKGNGEYEDLVTMSFATFRDRIVPRYKTE